MQFRFDDQPHQSQAIEAVIDLFESAVTPPSNVLLGQASGADGHAGFELSQSALEKNLITVTSRENVATQNAVELRAQPDLFDAEKAFPNFSVEMETGTGKTYVYIATALRLAQLYGLRKFVILVHSVAIRAGVLKTFEDTREHFQQKFPDLRYQWGNLGDSKAMQDFADPSSTVQFLVSSVQLLDKPDTNVLFSVPEQPQIWGGSQSGVEQIAALQPVVLVDEPQNMETPKRKSVIATLNPMFVLRYSATHRDLYNMVHRLTAKQAAEKNLVKRVSVKGVVPGADGSPYMYLKGIKAKRVGGRSKLLAEFAIDKSTTDGTDRTTVLVQPGAELFEESGGLEQYRGYKVETITRKPDTVVFENDKSIIKGEETGVDKTAIWRDQIRQAIRLHLSRETQITGLGYEIKVLSLFFVDRVGDYVGSTAVLPAIFDETFKEEWVRAGRAIEEMPEPSTLRVHYFPSTKTGIYKDTKGGLMSDSDVEARAYQEIIAQKELLLAADNPRAFIFSHSALREGWDNPNVFQIGFLRHSRSETERRQQIGRGLRLAVDQSGLRVFDPSVNRLALIVDETFKEFKAGVNAEYAASGGSSANDAPDIDDADEIVEIRRRSQYFESPEFDELWKRIRYKAVYRIEKVDQSTLVSAVAASEELDEISYIQKRTNIVQSADLEYDENGLIVTSDDTVAESAGEQIVLSGQPLPDILGLVERQLLHGKFPLQLTRLTIAKILNAIPKGLQVKVFQDADQWSRILARIIRRVVIDQMLENIVYEPSEEETWWDANMVFKELESKSTPKIEAGKPPPRAGVVEAPVSGLNLFDHVDYDSLVERNFAELLENSSAEVKLFTKIPRRFKIRTPVGEYSPDWGIVWEQAGVERVYLVRETKDTLDLADLEWDEALRIRFAKKHFEIAPSGSVDFTHTKGKSVRVASNP